MFNGVALIFKTNKCIQYPKLKETHTTQIISFEILDSGRPFISIINFKEFKNGETSELPDVFPALSKF